MTASEVAPQALQPDAGRGACNGLVPSHMGAATVRSRLRQAFAALRQRLQPEAPPAAVAVRSEDLGPEAFKNEILNRVEAYCNTMPAREALILLFEMDAFLYNLQGQKSVQYGNGLHTKHRHTSYHDFFVEKPALARL